MADEILQGFRGTSRISTRDPTPLAQQKTQGKATHTYILRES